MATDMQIMPGAQSAGITYPPGPQVRTDAQLTGPSVLLEHDRLGSDIPPPDQLRRIAMTTHESLHADADFEAHVRKLVIENEAYRPHVYYDSKHIPTVGIGFNLERGDARAKLASVGADFDAVRSGKAPLTEKQINTLFAADLASAEHDARKLVRNYDHLAPARKYVIVDMIFNMGAESFGEFKRTIGAIERGDYDQAAHGMTVSKWYSDTGDRAVRDIHRMKTGQW